MLRLFVKDNTSGIVHEYGTNRHDALILQDNGSLHYENMQCCAGTMFPEDGYSFCNEDGTIPKWDKEYGVEPYIDIGGEYYSKQTTNADHIRSMTDEELAKHLVDIGWDCHLCAEHRRLDNEPLLRGEKCDEKCAEHCLEWLQHPTEGE